MKITGSKSEVKAPLASAIEAYEQSGGPAFIDRLHSKILKKKIRFPVLEYITKELYNKLPVKEQIKLTNEIVRLMR